MLGIKYLTSLAITAFIICTGTLIGVLAVYNGEEATSEAETTGNVGVNNCIAGAVSNVEEVTRNLLGTTLKEIESKFRGFLAVPKRTLEELIRQLSSQHPDVTTSPHFLSEILRPQLAAKVYTTASKGVSQVGVFPYPFSPNSIEGKWGGTIGVLTADDTLGKLPESGEPVLMVLETSNDSGSEFQHNSLLADFGTANSRGEMIGRDEPCRAYADFTKGETSGYCRFPWSTVTTESWVELHDRAIDNAEFTTGVLEEADTVHYSPVSASGSFLTMQAYAAWTHPEMVNRYPRQGNRVGLVKVSLLATELTTMIKNQVLVEGSFLYCVDRDPWTNEVGVLVGVSEGNPFTRKAVESPFTGQTYQVASSVHVTNHTVAQIAQHGTHVLQHPDGYDEAIIQSSTLNPWTFSDPNSTTEIVYFTQVSALEQGTLKWYLSLLVPRDRIMKTINDTTSEIRFDFQNAKNDSDDKQQTNFMIMIIIVIVVSILLVVLAVAFTTKLFAPLTLLEQDMESVAFMRLDEVDSSAPLSMLSEVQKMQQSFRLMTQNLKEYRNYMPQSVLVMSEDDDVETDTSVSLSRTSSMLSRTRSSFTRTLSPTRSSFTRQAPESAAAYRCDPLEEITKRKTISVLVCNIRNWHGMISRLNDSELLNMHSDVISILFQSITANKGICDYFSGDHLQGMFNTIKPSSTHRTNCVDAGFQAAEKLPANAILSYAAGSGEARCGNGGCNGLKRYSAFATCIPWICDLERYNLQLGTRGLADKFCHAEAKQRYDLRCLDLVDYKKRSSELIRIFEVVRQLETRNEEWMYALDSQQASAWNSAMEAIFHSDWEDAKKELSQYKGQQDAMYNRLVDIIHNQTYSPSFLQCFKVTEFEVVHR